MIVAGVMSGTSADGIDVALVRVAGSRNSAPAARARRQGKSPRSWSDNSGRFQLLGHAAYAYPKPVRNAVLAAMNAARASVADLARLNFLLGELYAEAVLATARKFRIKAELVGCHGQTSVSPGRRQQNFLGKQLAVTWQTGEGAVIARA